MASRDGAELNETDQLELADWYKSTAQRPLDNLVKAGLLSRARTIYQAVLDAHVQEDGVRLRAQMQLSQSDAAPAKLPPPTDLSHWVDP